MAKVSNKHYKQFTISSLEDACLALKSLIVPVIIDLEKFKSYSKEAKEVLQSTVDSIPASIYDSLHDKTLYQQRELLRFLADHQSSSFSYINLRQYLVKTGYLKRNMDEEKVKVLTELLDIRNWSFHNAQSMLVADLEIAKKSIPLELRGIAEIKPLLNPVVIRTIENYSKEMLEGFVQHNEVRVQQIEAVLIEMKKDYQSMYESLPNEIAMVTGFGTTQDVMYLNQTIKEMNKNTAGSNIASLSMGIQKGKYDGTEEAYKRFCTEDE